MPVFGIAVYIWLFEGKLYQKHYTLAQISSPFKIAYKKMFICLQKLLSYTFLVKEIILNKQFQNA